MAQLFETLTQNQQNAGQFSQWRGLFLSDSVLLAI
jgi:hypothetical protein